MIARIYCKTTAKGIQSYYVTVEGEDYYLFSTKYRKSNKEFFSKGVDIERAQDFSASVSTSVRKVMEKLPAYLEYIEKEYDVTIFSNRAKKTDPEYKAQYCRIKKPYNRSKTNRVRYDLVAWDEDEYAEDEDIA